MAGGDLAGGKKAAADLGAWVCFEDEPGQGLRPPKGRTWGRRGQTPVVKVTGGHDTRVSLAALIAVRPGHRPRLIYRVHAGRGHGQDQRKGFTETEYARLPAAAHQQLGGPVVLVWDNLNTHVSRAMRELIAARPWLTVFQLPQYASELNPVEGIWSVLKRSLANLARRDIIQLTALVKTRLRRMQYRPGRPGDGGRADPGTDWVAPGVGQPDPGQEPLAGAHRLLDEPGIDVGEPELGAAEHPQRSVAGDVAPGQAEMPVGAVAADERPAEVEAVLVTAHGDGDLPAG